MALHFFMAPYGLKGWSPKTQTHPLHYFFIPPCALSRIKDYFFEFFKNLSPLTVVRWVIRSPHCRSSHSLSLLFFLYLFSSPRFARLNLYILFFSGRFSARQARLQPFFLMNFFFRVFSFRSFPLAHSGM